MEISEPAGRLAGAKQEYSVMRRRVRRSTWALFRLACAATIAGCTFAYVVGQVVPGAAVAG
jgi:hypothetical protein